MNLVELLSAPACLKLALALLHFLWQGAVLGALAVVLAVLFGGASAKARYRIYMASLFAMVLAVGVTFAIVESPGGKPSPLPAPEAATTPPQPVSLPVANPEKPDRPEPGASAGTSPAAVSAAVETAPPSGPLFELDWERYAPFGVGLYFVGVVAMLARFLIGYQGGQRLRRHAEPVKEARLLESLARMAQRIGLATAPSLAYCARVAVPTVVGVFKPAILLPVSFATGLTTEQVELLLCHELAHIRRWDPLFNVLQRVIEALLFFHPAVWILSRKIRIERENCCDDIVLATGGDSLEYASSLVETARRGLGAALPAEGLSATGKPSQLRGRVLRMIGSPTHEQFRINRASGLFAIGILLAVTVVPLASKETDAELNDPRKDKESRVVQFPEDFSLGALAIRDARIRDNWLEPKYLGEAFAKKVGFERTWEVFGNAQGQVEIPGGKSLALFVPDSWKGINRSVGEATRSHLEALAKLNPSDLQVLQIESCGFEDEDLIHLSGLTGLKATALLSGRIREEGLDGSGLVHLEGLENLEELSLVGQRHMANSNFRHLSPLRSLKTLSLDATNITDEGLAHLKALDSLRTLSLSGTNITDQGLETLAGISSIEDLRIGFRNVTDKGFQKLQELPRLKTLRFGGERLSGEVLKYLRDYPTVENLDISSIPISNDQAAYLAEIPNVKSIYIYNAPFSDEGISNLAKSPSLERIKLFDVPITPNCIPSLKGIPTLTEMMVAGFGEKEIGEDFLDSLKAELPGVDVWDMTKGPEYPPTGWRKRFAEVYRLEEDQVLKRIPLPFIPERLNYYQNPYAGHPAPTSATPVAYVFEWNRALGTRPRTMGYCSKEKCEPPTLKSLIGQFGLQSYEITGSEDLLNRRIAGDWILRANADKDKIFKALTKILQAEVDLPASIQNLPEEEERVVARGEFHFKPLQGGEDETIYLFADKRDPEVDSGGCTGCTFSELLDVLRGFYSIPIVDESTNGDSKKYEAQYYQIDAFHKAKESPEELRKLHEQLLNNLSEQTSLEFTFEKRKADKWVVEEAKKAESQGLASPNSIIDRELAAWNEWRDRFLPSGEVVPASVSEAAAEGLRLEGGYLVMPRDADGTPIQKDIQWAAQYFEAVAKPCSITGVVIDKDGKPLAGAVIRAGLRFSVGDHVVQSAEVKPVETDSEGRFEIAGVPEGPYLLTAVADGYLGARSEVLEVNRQQPRAEAEFTLTWGNKLRGRVVDTEGNPVSEVRAVVCGHTSANGGTSYRADHEKLNDQTDEEGRFEIEVEEAGTYNILLEPDAHAKQIVYEVDPGADPPTIELTPGGSVSGRILVTKGETEVPLPEVTVRAESKDRSSYSWLGRHETTTDAEGRFSFPHLQKLQRASEIMKSGWENRKWVITCQGFERTIDFEDSDKVEDIKLVVRESEQWTVSGQATDAVTGEPLKRFIVDHAVGSWNSSPQPKWKEEQTVENEEGKFTVQFDKIQPNRRVRVRAEGYKPAVSEDLSGVGGDTEIIFSLQPGGGFSAKVIDADGKPAAGASVLALRPDHAVQIRNGYPDPSDAYVLLTTDSEGRFAIVDQEEPYSLLLFHDKGFARVESASLQSTGEITLIRWGRVGGVAMKGTTPWGDQEIQLDMDPNSDWYQTNGPPHVHYQYNTKSDEDGRFQFDRVFPNTYMVGRSVRTYWFGNRGGVAPSHTKKVDVAEGKEVEVKIGGPGITVRGQVSLDRQLDPPVDLNQGYVDIWLKKGFLMQAFGNDFDESLTRRYVARLEPDGRFDIPAVAPGAYEMDIKIMDPRSTGPHSFPKPIAEVKGRTVNIPPSDQGEEQASHDLGKIEVSLAFDGNKEG